MTSFPESIKGEQRFFILWFGLLQMCAPEFPLSSPQLYGVAEKVGRKLRRERTTSLLSEEEMDVLKRKPTTPVKPPVSEKAFFQSDLNNVTNDCC